MYKLILTVAGAVLGYVVGDTLTNKPQDHKTMPRRDKIRKATGAQEEKPQEPAENKEEKDEKESETES